jgi:hypothetical protein
MARSRLVTQPWLKFECPTCHAAIGESCKSKFKGFRFACASRMRLVPVHIPDWQLKPRREIPLIEGRRYSAYCKQNRHERCSGATGWNHGLRLPCQCQCHGDPVRYLPENLHSYPHKKIRPPVNPLHSTKCQKDRHQECKGVRRLPNNLYAPCGCECHITQKSDAK